MKSSGIYVELPIRTAMDVLWEHTQNPALHQEWDLRFTTIDYLPKQFDDEPQSFLYTTQIGFGVKVSGAGESSGTRHVASGERTSALKFWSDEPISLIQTGSGYWKYIPGDGQIRFLTWYDYQVRFGAVGQLFDRLVFRPLLGWATAWSFDCLRQWLERGIQPALSLRRWLIQMAIQLTLATIWIYQGIVPKLLFPDSGELGILRATGLFPGIEPTLIVLIGVAEVIFGLLFLMPRFGRRLHFINMAALLFLGLGALISQPTVLVAPFNPVTLNLAMMALSLIALWNDQNLPSARHCLRRPKPA